MKLIMAPRAIPHCAGQNKQRAKPQPATSGAACAPRRRAVLDFALRTTNRLGFARSEKLPRAHHSNPSANSILLVTYARDEQLAGKPALEAAVEAGVTRIRPVLMTATAMIVGMIPMAIGEPGGEQNAVLARAVVGGLLFATPTTLLLVPYLFATLRRGADGKVAHGVFAEGLE